MVKSRYFSFLFAVLCLAAGLGAFYSAELSSGWDAIAGDHGDTRLVTYLLEHVWQFLQGKVELLSPREFFPAQGTLGYSVGLAAMAPPFVFFRFLGWDRFSAFQGASVFCEALNFFCAYLFFRKGLRFKSVTSSLGAFFFAFNSAVFCQSNHIQLAVHYPIPLIAFCVAQLVRAQSPSRLFLWVSCAALLLEFQVLTESYSAIFSAIFFVFCLGFVFAWSRTRSWFLGWLKSHVSQKYWGAWLGAGIVAAVGAVPVALLYGPAIRTVGWRSYDQITMMIPRLRSFLWMGHSNFVWGWLPRTFGAFDAIPVAGEHRMGLGIVALLSWIWIVYLSLRRRKVVSLESRTPGLVEVILILTGAVTLFYLVGCWYRGHSPWYLIYLLFPGAKSIRAVSRYPLILALPIAAVLCFWLEQLWGWVLQRQSHRQRMFAMVAVSGVVVFSGFEQQGGKATFSKSQAIAWESRALRQLPKNCDSFYVTIGKGYPQIDYVASVDAILVSQLSGVPTLNGYSGMGPPGWALGEPASNPNYLGEVRKWAVANKLDSQRICQLELTGE